RTFTYTREDWRAASPPRAFCIRPLWAYRPQWADTESEENSMTYFCRGIRGATTAEANTREAILEATRDMLERLIAENGLRQEDIASAIFSTTPDLNAEFPAVAARALGWLDTALICTHEMAVPGS